MGTLPLFRFVSCFTRLYSTALRAAVSRARRLAYVNAVAVIGRMYLLFSEEANRILL